MTKICRIAVASALALMALPSAAHAASIKVEDGLLGLLGEKTFTYEAAPGEKNKVSITQSGSTLTISERFVPINVGLANGLCLSLDAWHVNCVVSSAYAIEFVTGDGDDNVYASGATSDLRIEAGSGHDEIFSGSGDDRLLGGEGNDVIRGGLGADRVEGEGGSDVADYADSASPVSVTPDGRDNDGAVGEGDDVEGDVEGAAGGGGDDTLVASSAGGKLLGRGGADTLIGAAGGDSLDGGGGIDNLSGAGGADTIYSRDDLAESPICGGGVDKLLADPLDSPSIDCESIEVLIFGEPGDTGGVGLGKEPSGSDDPSGDGNGDDADANATDVGLPAPPPTRGVQVNAQPDRGTISVRLPGSDGYIELTGDSGIPVGSVVDASNGTVSITSALDADGNTQTATFWGGSFKIRQRRNSPVVDIVLTGGDFSSCGRSARAGSATAVTAGRRARRRLWSRDRRGRYRTKGRHSVATVRGTRWLTVDRCNGTLTRVTEGAVSVRALGRRKRELVRAGDSHVAHRR
jgi:Ca2+-binding RTX toxin-like protein